MNSESLADIEAIKQLKARYFRLLDEKRWDELRALFSDDFRGVFSGPHPDIHYAGPDEMIGALRETLGSADSGVPTVHHGHMPEIALTGADEAEGTWAMMDIVALPEAGFRGYGHYRDRYRRIGGAWRIARTELRRLRVEPDAPADAG